MLLLLQLVKHEFKAFLVLQYLVVLLCCLTHWCSSLVQKIVSQVGKLWKRRTANRILNFELIGDFTWSFSVSDMTVTWILWLSLKAMRKGLLDVLPKNSLEDLTAEDFRLLVNGCGEVNVQMLISFTSFNDESGMKQLIQEQSCRVNRV